MANQIGNRQVSIYVCANSEYERKYWVDQFSRFFVASTRVDGLGSWQDNFGIVWHENNTVVSHIYLREEPDFDHDQLNILIQEYKCACEQQVVLVTYQDVEAFLA